MATIIRAEQFDPVVDAMRLVTAQQERASQLAQECEAALESAKIEGRDIGRREGLEIIAAHLGEALSKAEHDILALEDRISSIVFRAIGMVLGEMEPEERFRRLVAHALKEVAGGVTAVIKVPPEDEAMAFAALKDCHPQVSVAVDKYMRQGEVILETDSTRTQIGLADQLSNLLEAVNRG